MGTNHRNLPKIQNTLLKNKKQKNLQPFELQVTARAEHWSSSTKPFYMVSHWRRVKNETDFFKMSSKEYANKSNLRC